jgi:hypothetical protein
MTHGKEKAVIEAIDRTYGIATSDTALKEMMNKLESKNIFQSKNLMFINKMMMDVAEDNHGSLYAGARHFYAHSIDEDGNLKYDERKTSGFTLLMQASDELIKDRNSTTLLKLRWLNRGTGLMRIQILHTRIEP